MRLLDESNRQLVLHILANVYEMSLATLRPDGYPQATTINYAHDGLALYACVNIDSQKAHNIRQNNKVSLTINAYGQEGNRIQGLSMAALAEIIATGEAMRHASECLLKRFSKSTAYVASAKSIPWEGCVFLKIQPQIISLIDYTETFGHSELFGVS